LAASGIQTFAAKFYFIKTGGVNEMGYEILKNLKSVYNEYGKIIRNRSVTKLVSAGFISSIGSKISYFALLKKVYDLSNGKITDLGFLTIAQCIPYIIFGALAGIIIDRFSRKKIMILSDCASGLVTLCVIFVNNLVLIYAIAFVAALVNVFRTPAQRSMEPNLVEAEDISLLNSFNSMSNSIIMILGSALGAAIVGFVGVKDAFIIDSISFYLSAIIISLILVEEKHIAVKKEIKGFEYIKEFRDGASIMWKNSTLKLILLIDLYLTFAMAMQGPLIYIFIKQSLHMGSRAEFAWGTLLSTLGIGSICGSLIIGILVKKYKNKFKLFLNILVFDSVFFTMFLLNKYFPLSIVIFAFLGVIGTAHNIILNTTIQNTVSDDSRGKVFSALSMISNPISILSILTGTVCAQYISAKNVLLLVAGLEALIAIGVRFTKSYRFYDNTVTKGEKPVSL
jgi:MFS transporter, DHA3 family, macrolide efflux protein